MSSEARTSSRSRWPAIALGVLASGATLHGLQVALASRDALGFAFGGAFWLGVGALIVSLGFCAQALLLEIIDLRGGSRQSSPLAFVRLALVALGATWVLFLLFVQPFQRIWFDMALGLAAGIWASACLVQRWLAPRFPRLTRIGDTVLFSLCLAIIVAELGLRSYDTLRPSAILTHVGSSPRQLIDRFRCSPGQLRFGYACNADGFYDSNFEATPAELPLVIAIGDSFNVGAVPQAWHYTSVCEELLDRPVHNMGVAGIGPPEYLYLLIEEALPLAPDVIVIALFMGNDLSVVDVESGLPDPFLRSWFQRERVLTWVLVDRVRKIRSEKRRVGETGRGVAGVQGESGGVLDEGRAAVAARFPWLADPLLEEPTLSQEAFLRLETERALQVCAGVPRAFDLTCEVLLQAKRAAGSTPLYVVLIPDEFQVEDDLWQAISAAAGRQLERDLPQRLLKKWLAEQAIRTLDLLPVLRAVPQLEDGRRHLYHLQDTHFNARGNRVAGEALADFLR